MSALSDGLEPSKSVALERAGILWLEEHTVWVHPEQQKVISNEWACDASLGDLQAEIRETVKPGDWSFRSHVPMSEATKDAIKRAVAAKRRRA